MKLSKRIRYAKLLFKVAKLQGYAPEGTIYNLEYGGQLNDLYFVKFQCINGKYVTQFRTRSDEMFGVTLKELEKQISTELKIAKLKHFI